MIRNIIRMFLATGRLLRAFIEVPPIKRYYMRSEWPTTTHTISAAGAPHAHSLT